MISGKIIKIVIGILMVMQNCHFAGGADRIARLDVKSADFNDSEQMPRRHAFDRGNISPSIVWSNVPEGTKTIALICDDPDAPRGDWAHWVIFNIPSGSRGLPEGVPKQKKLPDGSLQGINDFRMFGYDGPAPPQGTHRYVFKVFALDIFLNLEAGAAKKDVLAAMTGHILAEGRLEGRYKKEIDRLSKPVI